MYKTEQALIEGKKLTATMQRILILHYILAVGDHPSADDIIGWAKKNLPKVSVATIYNTLNTFVDKGLIKTITLPNSKIIHYDKNIKHHYHVIDSKTGELYDLPEEAVHVSPKVQGFNVNKVDVFIYGNKISESS